MPLNLKSDDKTAVHAFLEARDILPLRGSLHERLHQVMRAFAPVLYENLSKIRRRAAYPRLGPECLETPAVLLRDHLEKGTGGTCYSLAYSLAAVLESAGIDCYLTLNDIRGHHANHAAVVAKVDGATWLCDPGVQLRAPAVFSPSEATRTDNGYCQAHIVPTETPGDFNVTLQLPGAGSAIPSFVFHSKPVDELPFRQVWLGSFTGFMMNTFHIFRHCDTRVRHLLFGLRQDKIPGGPEMKEPVTLENLAHHVQQIWPEIPEGQLDGAGKALIARGASPVMSYEDCLKAAQLESSAIPSRP